MKSKTDYECSLQITLMLPCGLLLIHSCAWTSSRQNSLIISGFLCDIWSDFNALTIGKLCQVLWRDEPKDC